jgi:hypothetical protein
VDQVASENFAPILFFELTEPLSKYLILTLCFDWQAKNALVGTFLFLDQIVWAGRTGIYKVWIQNCINTT